MRLVQIADLHGEIAHARSRIFQTLDPVDIQPEIPQVVFDEETVFILLEDFCRIQQLFIVVQKLPDIAADLIDPVNDLDARLMDDRIFHLIEFMFILVDQLLVILHHLRQEIAQEPLQARISPSFCGCDHFDHVMHRPAVVDKNDSLFIQCECEDRILARKIRSPRNGKCTGDRIVVDLRLGGKDQIFIRIMLDTHVEPVLMPPPFFPREHGRIRQPGLQHVQRLRLGRPVLNNIAIHPAPPFPAWFSMITQPGEKVNHLLYFGTQMVRFSAKE